MTNMKALQMFDHVMLWVARAFALLFLSFATWGFVLCFCLDGPASWNDPIKCVSLLVVALLAFICAWRTYSRPSRVCLGLIAGYFFIRVGMIAVTLVPTLHFLLSPSAELSHMALNVITLLGFELCGFAVMLWTAFRPSHPPSDPSSLFENHPLPQSC